MPKKLQEIVATVSRVKWRADGDDPFVIMDATYANGSARPAAIVLKGNMDDDHPKQHLSYRFYGVMSESEYRGRSQTEFKFQTFVAATPHTRAGVITYLEAAPGLGRVLAGRLFDKFGGEAVKILREQPDVAAAACDRLSAEAADEASAYLVREQALEDCTIELVDLLGGRGFPKAVVKQAVKEYGNRAASVIKADPYRLMAFRGCGFKRADALYLDLGLPPAKLKRQAYCATYHARQTSDQNGDTWVYRAAVDRGLAGAIGGASVQPDKAILLAERGGIMAVMRTDGVGGPPHWDGESMWVADARNAASENRLAGYVCEALRDDARWPADLTFGDMSPHQIEQARTITAGTAIGILGGGPGVGKTFVAAQLIRAAAASYGYHQIAAAAPTGKAAVRLTEVMSGYGIPLVARTIHSLLKVSSSDGGWSFMFHAANRLPFKVLVIDEASMIDCTLAASLFAARARGTLMLILGDVGQLPPVGHGAPLRDFIAGGVPYGELTEIHRNEGGIVQACADIQAGRPFACGGNLELAPAESPAEQKEAVLSAVDAKARALGVDPVWGVQVLCAVNTKSEVSRRDLNKRLQQELNPSPATPGSPFRLGDKVICTKNNWLPLVEVKRRPGSEVVDAIDNDDNLALNDDGKVYVANGELGECVRVEPNYFHVQLTAPRRLVVVPRGKAQESDEPPGDEEGNAEETSGTGCDWELGYAISAHKSQGSEWPAVVVVVDESGGAKRVCSREWMKTAISRAKRSCVLVGRLATAQQFCRRTAIDKRKTFLRERIQAGRSTL